ncbi:phage portal protein [Caulobacter sp. 1776]|uniref:phage portal protein n=1 Tax=Caulobacter sp. 1776 TaxID=3156420 RepID=UPI003391DDBB
MALPFGQGRSGPVYQPLVLTDAEFARPGASARDQLRGPYAGASMRDPDLAGWTPYNWSGHDAISADYDALTTRVHDFARNNGWASAALQKYVDTVVGAGWVFISQPNVQRLGITEEAGAEWAAAVEAFLDDVTTDPDLWLDRERTSPFGLQIALAMRHRMADGNAIGLIGWRERGGPLATWLQIIDPDRLSNPSGMINNSVLKDGVALDPIDFAPIGYHFRVSHPSEGYDGANMRWEYVEREIAHPAFGTRRQVVHAFEPGRAGERRGISQLASVLKKMRLLDRYDETEAQAALINAIMAAFVTSPNDHGQLADAMDDEGAEDIGAYQDGRLRHHENHPLRMRGANVNFLYPGESVTLTNPNHPNAVYDPFVRVGLRNISAAFGLSYEQLTGDLSQVNYASIRAGLLDVKRGFVARKSHFSVQLVAPFGMALIQEGIARGMLKLPAGGPAFRDAKAAYCAGEWAGAGLGEVDPLKEANAMRERLALRITTRRREAAERGMRFRQVLSEAAREDAEMRKVGIDPTVSSSAATKPPEDPAADEAPAKGNKK